MLGPVRVGLSTAAAAAVADVGVPAVPAAAGFMRVAGSAAAGPAGLQQDLHLSAVTMPAKHRSVPAGLLDLEVRPTSAARLPPCLLEAPG
uniref:Uncharacterized protein n=1 Tax=Chromera velia CCMP2878 TaxID=1169474 RepID=A0A0G4GPY3_9ALVE|eukprot:Cvel_22875.t1-p1 / transcript=Cvel_22875.t1 / gene=Cvel_22875 / organism=Chromera_velia_CCMP2878 / gene_product=hypothetical protein / transcript_product=hypothetical protein / location=Cvel_scaffold2297:16212-16478(-) / protein_length=89 / sequence_SO=supercontig / SO=protein_coding / is_pseudo=false